MHDQDLPNWSNDSVDDRLNNMVWCFTLGGILLTTNVQWGSPIDCIYWNSVKTVGR
jgi:hypothetical protein